MRDVQKVLFMMLYFGNNHKDRTSDGENIYSYYIYGQVCKHSVYFPKGHLFELL